MPDFFNPPTAPTLTSPRTQHPPKYLTLVMADFWLSDLSLQDELNRVTSSASTELSPDARKGHQEACFARIANLLGVDSDTDEVRLASLTNSHVEMTLGLASEPVGTMPLCPPVRTLTRCCELERELGHLKDLGCTAGIATSGLRSLLCDTSARLAKSYAANATAKLVAPFIYACLDGTRGFLWGSNGDSLALCALIGLCRCAAVEAHAISSSGSGPPDCSAAATKLVSTLLASELFKASAELFVLSAAQVEARAEAAANGARQLNDFTALAQAAVPTLMTKATLDGEVLPRLAVAAGTLPTADERSNCDACPIHLTMEALLDSFIRDAAFLPR